jgi:hypothetical protein
MKSPSVRLISFNFHGYTEINDSASSAINITVFGGVLLISFD